MKQYFLMPLLLFVSLIFIPACSNDDNNAVLTEQEKQFNDFCNSSNGTMTLSIDGENWGESCVIAISTGLPGQGSQFDGVVSVIGFTNFGAFLNQGKWEAFSITFSTEEGIMNYPTSNSTIGMCYFDGLNTTLNDPNNAMEGNYFCNEEIEEFTTLEIQRNGNNMTGNFEGNLSNSDNSESVSVSGSFNVNF